MYHKGIKHKLDVQHLPQDTYATSNDINVSHNISYPTLGGEQGDDSIQIQVVGLEPTRQKPRFPKNRLATSYSILAFYLKGGLCISIYYEYRSKNDIIIRAPGKLYGYSRPRVVVYLPLFILYSYIDNPINTRYGTPHCITTLYHFIYRIDLPGVMGQSLILSCQISSHRSMSLSANRQTSPSSLRSSYDIICPSQILYIMRLSELMV